VLRAAAKNSGGRRFGGARVRKSACYLCNLWTIFFCYNPGMPTALDSIANLK